MYFVYNIAYFLALLLGLKCKCCKINVKLQIKVYKRSKSNGEVNLGTWKKYFFEQTLIGPLNNTIKVRLHKTEDKTFSKSTGNISIKDR